MTFTSDCDYTLLRANEMDNYDQAIELINAKLPDQFQKGNTSPYPDEPMDNEWNDASTGSGVATDRVTGSIMGGLNPIEWYYRTSGGKYDPLEGGMTIQIISVSPLTAVTVVCDAYSNKHSRALKFGEIVGDTLRYSVNYDENVYLAKTKAYRELRADTTVLTAGDANDSAFHAFYSFCDTSNIGLLEAIAELISDTLDNIALATSMNAAINDTNDLEMYHKEMNSIYLNRLALHEALDENDSSDCDYVTGLAFHEAGEAIFSAAYMIGKEVHFDATQALRLMESDHHTISDKLITNNIYPNPAKDYFVLPAIENGIYKVELYSMQGTLVRALKTNGDIFIVSDCPAGCYTVKITDKTQSVFYNKLCVVR